MLSGVLLRAVQQCLGPKRRKRGAKGGCSDDRGALDVSIVRCDRLQCVGSTAASHPLAWACQRGGGWPTQTSHALRLPLHLSHLSGNFKTSESAMAHMAQAVAPAAGRGTAPAPCSAAAAPGSAPAALAARCGPAAAGRATAAAAASAVAARRRRNVSAAGEGRSANRTKWASGELSGASSSAAAAVLEPPPPAADAPAAAAERQDASDLVRCWNQQQA